MLLMLEVGAFVAFVAGIILSRCRDTTSWGLALLTLAYLLERGVH